MISAGAADADAPPDRLFLDENAPLLPIWDVMQRLQTDLCMDQELSAFYTWAPWHRARTVIDLGTGNGYYLGRLAATFPEKEYRGVDKLGALIDIAERDHRHDGVSFDAASVFDVAGSFDFALARLLVQHLDDVGLLLNAVERILNPGGSLFVIDALDTTRFFHPALPRFMTFWHAYVDAERRAGRDRDAALTLDRALAAHPKLRLADTVRLLIPTTLPGRLDLVRRTYGTFIDLVETAAVLAYDFEDVRAEWRRWCALPDAYAQVGLAIARVERV